jgi:cytochrome c-type biogenesis protein CcmH
MSTISISYRQITAAFASLLLLLSALVMVAPAQAAIEAYQFDSDEQEALFRELAAELRCPKCQNQNIADSNAGLAKDLREKVYEMVKEGQDKDQVVDFMIARYGDFVHYQPPSSAAVVIIAAPVTLIVIAVLVIGWRVRSGRKVAADSGVDQEKLQRLLAGTAMPSSSKRSAKTGTQPGEKENR